MSMAWIIINHPKNAAWMNILTKTNLVIHGMFTRFTKYWLTAIYAYVQKRCSYETGSFRIEDGEFFVGSFVGGSGILGEVHMHIYLPLLIYIVLLHFSRIHILILSHTHRYMCTSIYRCLLVAISLLLAENFWPWLLPLSFFQSTKPCATRMIMRS